MYIKLPVPRVEQMSVNVLPLIEPGVNISVTRRLNGTIIYSN